VLSLYILMTAFLSSLTPSILAKACTLKVAKATEVLPHLLRAAEKYEINTPKRMAAWLGQLVVESGYFTCTEENLNYSAEGLLTGSFRHYFTPQTAAMYARQPEKIANIAYGMRGGNVKPGDGWRYRGRGWIQLSLLGNYIDYEQSTGVPVVANPDCLLQPAQAALSGAWYFHKHQLNQLADEWRITAISIRVNGGKNGLAERIAASNKALAVLEKII